MTAEPFRIGFVPGVMPDKWLVRWRERNRGTVLEAFPVADAEQRTVLVDGIVDMCFVRLPINPDGLHLVRLYVETPVVVMAKEHVLTLLDEVGDADLGDEIRNQGPVGTAIETAAAGTGVVVVPASLARLHQRRDVVTRPYSDGEDSCVALAWRADRDDKRAQDFVGVVKGRSPRSSR